MNERCVLDKAVGIEQVSDVLTRRSVTALATAGHCVGTAVVASDCVSLDHRCEVGADRTHLRRRVGVDRGDAHRAGLDVQQWGVRRHRRPRLDEHCGDHPGDTRAHDVLHLHRLEHHERVARGDLRTDLHLDRQNGGGHRCPDDLHVPFLVPGSISRDGSGARSWADGS